eukprot:TRINITY_DN30135_c0_g1_i1.p1 TRINITY_DN30135_c0_g1~~TRINITY_DN30135_c0_g1_i1.p1  ORF type:complete len:287 (-),score=40.96 TRINITY_DN30135_c0_g1_i1:191-979(-)
MSDSGMSLGRGSKGKFRETFRTNYALAAPDYNMHDCLGMSWEELGRENERVFSFPGRQKGSTPVRRKALIRSKSATSQEDMGIAPLVSRWWLHDLRAEQSPGEGLYEVTTGIVKLHDKPDRATEPVAALRSGTRFRATPYLVGRSTWLLVTAEGRTAPLLKTNNSSSVFGPKGRRTSTIEVEDTFTRLHERSMPEPLSPFGGVLEEANALWVEDNLQYLFRIRDIDREKGFRSYSVCQDSLRVATQRRISHAKLCSQMASDL